MGFEIEEEGPPLEAAALVPEVRQATIPITMADVEKAIAQARLDLAVYEEEIKNMKVEASLLKVEDDITHQKSVELGIRAKRLGKAIDKESDRITGPAKQFNKAVGNFTKAYTTTLDQIEAITKQKNGSYKALQRLKEQEAQQILEEETRKLNEKVKEEAKRIGVEAEVVATPILAKTQKVVRTSEGMAYSSEYWKFEAGPVHRNDANYQKGKREIVYLEGKQKEGPLSFHVKFEIEVFGELHPGAGNQNIHIVSVNDKLLPIIPAEFLIPDQKELRKAVDAGRREIEGVKIYRADKEIYK